MEKIQMTFFWGQETFLSIVYLYYTYRLLGNFHKTDANKSQRQVFIVCVVCLGQHYNTFLPLFYNTKVGHRATTKVIVCTCCFWRFWCFLCRCFFVILACSVLI